MIFCNGWVDVQLPNVFLFWFQIGFFEVPPSKVSHLYWLFNRDPCNGLL